MDQKQQQALQRQHEADRYAYKWATDELAKLNPSDPAMQGRRQYLETVIKHLFNDLRTSPHHERGGRDAG